MLAELRHHLTPKRVLIAAAILCALALLLPLMEPYSGGVAARLEYRHLMARGRAPEQLQQQEAARQRATEEAARQSAAEARAAEQRRAQEAQDRAATARAAERMRAEEEARRAQQAERRRQEEELRSNVAEYRRVMEPHLPIIRHFLQNAGSAVEAVAKQASDPAFYTNAPFTLEEAATNRACGDPASTADLAQRQERRRRNIYACAVYLAKTRDERASARVAANVLLQRIYHPQEWQGYPVPTLVAYVWIGTLNARVPQGQDLPRLPELTEGDSFSPAIFGDTLAPGFGRWLIDLAQLEEKRVLGDVIYRDLRRLYALGGQIVQTCRALRRTDCLADD